jgi:hypothetical protein
MVRQLRRGSGLGAARLADRSRADEVVLSHAVVQSEEGCRLAESLGTRGAVMKQLRGLPDTFELHALRLTV